MTTRRSIRRTWVAVVALILAGCATTSAPTVQGENDASYSASPLTSSPSGFASPQNLLEKYPEMRRQGP